MYCYIQEIQMKSSNSIGYPKELVVTTSNWTVNGIPYFSYGYTYSDDKFERPIKTAYKISIHDKSFRDDKGKVRKKQYYFSTIKYYDLVDYSWYDCMLSVEKKINEIAVNLGIDAELLWTEIEDKLDALEDRIKKEFAQTEEAKVKAEHDSIIKAYQKAKREFVEKYEVNESEYDRCYDIFGKLRKPEYFKKIESDYQARKEYEEKSRSYQRDYYSNYNNHSGSYGTSSFNSGLSSEKEKEYYKKFYRTLAMKYHPDVTGSNEEMQFLNKLKEQWGI